MLRKNDCRSIPTEYSLDHYFLISTEYVMSFDLDLVRAILRQFGVMNDAKDFLSADGVSLSPPLGIGNSEALPAYIDRLVDVGLLRRTNDIHMKYHPDPVTLRVTEEGRVWVRRACDDVSWAEAVPHLERLVKHGEQ